MSLDVLQDSQVDDFWNVDGGGPDGDQQTVRLHPCPNTYDQKFGRMRREIHGKKKRIWRQRSRCWTMLESSRELILSVLMTWSSRTP